MSNIRAIRGETKSENMYEIPFFQKKETNTVDVTYILIEGMKIEGRWEL